MTRGLFLAVQGDVGGAASQIAWNVSTSLGVNFTRWVGAGTHINPGLTVGDNAIIGSGSVVRKDVPANVIGAGSPCRVLRTLTENDRTGFTI